MGDGFDFDVFWERSQDFVTSPRGGDLLGSGPMATTQRTVLLLATAAIYLVTAAIFPRL